MAGSGVRVPEDSSEELSSRQEPGRDVLDWGGQDKRARHRCGGGAGVGVRGAVRPLLGAALPFCGQNAARGVGTLSWGGASRGQQVKVWQKGEWSQGRKP